MSADRGRFVWYELMTKDPEAAKSFYTTLAGWGTEDWEGAGQPYTMWTQREQPLGGVMTLPDEAAKAGAPPHWMGYVSTPNVDETISQATSLGAQVPAPPMDIPTVGRFAVLADPQGAVIAVYTSASESPRGGAQPEEGQFSWHELATTDYEAAFTFYRSVFGWEKTEAMDMGEAGIYLMYKEAGGAAPLGGIFNKPKEMPGPPAWLYYIMVDDAQSKAEQVKKLGGRILNGPMEVPGGDWIVQCLDPQGAAFALHSRKKEN